MSLNLLVLGGTAWLGREVTRQALDRGHAVTCLARGESGLVADGAELVRGDRAAPDAYAAVADREWDAVIEVSWQPGLVRGALAALSERAGHWTYVSSTNVYADQAQVGIDERAPRLAPTDRDEAPGEMYGAAKVACEDAVLAARGGEGCLIARAGLIAGPGDLSDRGGAWVARAARDPTGPLLVPVPDGQLTQVIDVRDLAAWLLDAGETGRQGVHNAVGETLLLEEWIALSRRVGGHRGEVVSVPSAWLRAQGVEEFMGPDSLALWIVDPAWRGFCAASGAAARRAGLAPRPLEATLADVLADERRRGLDRVRTAGLSPTTERALLARWATETA